jgi:hypothetical protein
MTLSQDHSMGPDGGHEGLDDPLQLGGDRLARQRACDRVHGWTACRVHLYFALGRGLGTAGSPGQMSAADEAMLRER